MTSIIIKPEPTGAESAPVIPGRGRWAAAALFVVGAGLQAAEFVLENPSSDNAVRVGQWLAHPARIAASMSVGLLAVPFLLGGFAILVVITRRQSPRLAVVAGAFLAMAMIGLAGVHGVEMSAFNLVISGQPAAAIATLDPATVTPPLAVLMGLFLGGAVLGTGTLAAAMWRSPRLPRITAFGVVAFAVLDFAAGSPLISHLVALANSVVIAWAVVSGYSRRPGSRSTLRLR